MPFPIVKRRGTLGGETREMRVSFTGHRDLFAHFTPSGESKLMRTMEIPSFYRQDLTMQKSGDILSLAIMGSSKNYGYDEKWEAVYIWKSVIRFL